MSAQTSSAPTYPKLHDREWLHQRHVMEGKSPFAIAREVGCAYSLVVRALARAGIKPRIQPRSDRKWDPSRDELLTAYREAGSLTRLAEAKGISAGTVRNIFSRLGVAPEDYEPSRRVEYPQLDDLDRLHQLADAMTLSEMSVELQVPRPALIRALADIGASPRERSAEADAIRSEAIRMYVEGASLSQVAVRFGYDPSYIWRWLDKAGVVRPRPKRSAAQWDKPDPESRLRRKLAFRAGRDEPGGVLLTPSEAQRLLNLLEGE